MKTCINRGFSSDPRSLYFPGFRSNARESGRTKAEKIDGASGALSQRAKQIATALFAPSGLDYRRLSPSQSKSKREGTGEQRESGSMAILAPRSVQGWQRRCATISAS